METWNLTPRELEALYIAAGRMERRTNHRLAVLLATLHNAWFRSKDHHPEAYQASDFLAAEDSGEPAPPAAGQTVEQKKAIIGTVLRSWKAFSVRQGKVETEANGK